MEKNKRKYLIVKKLNTNGIRNEPFVNEGSSSFLNSSSPKKESIDPVIDYLEKNSPMGQIAEKNLDHQTGQIALARNLGVPIAMGTDAGSPGVHHGRAVRHEIKILMQAGFSIEEAIQCAAQNSARLLGLTRYGHLSIGMPASFIAVKGAPSDLPDSLSSVEAIYVDGKPMKR